MTFGVDQCRVCGVPIKAGSPRAFMAWQKAQQRPPIPEKEWRRRGFLAAPTPEQLRVPANGCCQACGLVQMRRRYPAFKRLALLSVVAVILFAGVWVAISFVPFNGIGRGGWSLPNPG